MHFSRKFVRPLALAVAILSAALPAWATRVQPMVYELTPFGSSAEQDVRVENNSDRPLPVELRVERRFIAIDGSETRLPAEDDFLIFPPQGLVPPNGFQTFRVRYIGDATLRKTALYVVTIAQLPLVSADPATGVQILVNLGTSVAVSPPKAKARVALTDVQPAAQAGMLNVTVANTGDKFARLYDGTWTFKSGDRSVVMESDALRSAITQPLLEAESTRVISLPVPTSLAGELVTVEFDYVAPASTR